MIVDGKKIAQEIQNEIKISLEGTKTRNPCLAVILVGDHPASRIYVERKTKACHEVGIQSLKLELPRETTEKELLDQIHTLNNDPLIDGILVQLPLPPHINASHINAAISPDKDVDGFHPINAGKMLMGEHDGFLPCTPLGIRVLLERYHIEVTGKHVVILGRSNIVGKPLAAILMQNSPEGNATVSIAHSKTVNLSTITQQADIIIVAIGQPEFLKADMIKKGAVVIDVGINKIADPSRSSGYRLVGDVDYNQIKDICSFITPVPGGVGPMTIAMLLSNTVKSYQRRMRLHSPA